MDCGKGDRVVYACANRLEHVVGQQVRTGTLNPEQPVIPSDLRWLCYHWLPVFDIRNGAIYSSAVDLKECTLC